MSRFAAVLLIAFILSAPAFADELADAQAACQAIGIAQNPPPSNNPLSDHRANIQHFSECVTAQRMRQAEKAALDKTPPAVDQEALQRDHEAIRARQQATIDAIRAQLGFAK